jgi:hypothetical protein
MLCAECNDPFISNHYHLVCDLCGDYLSRRYDQLQEFRVGVLDLSVVASRAVFGEGAEVEKVWRVG